MQGVLQRVIFHLFIGILKDSSVEVILHFHFRQKRETLEKTFPARLVASCLSQPAHTEHYVVSECSTFNGSHYILANKANAHGIVRKISNTRGLPHRNQAAPSQVFIRSMLPRS